MGYAHAQQLVRERAVVLDDRGAWSEHRPSAKDENRLIDEQGLEEYAKWFLGVDDSEEAEDDSKRRFKFPFGDFQRVHRCGVLAAESRAGQYRHHEIERAAAHLHGLLEALREERPNV